VEVVKQRLTGERGLSLERHGRMDAVDAFRRYGTNAEAMRSRSAIRHLISSERRFWACKSLSCAEFLI